GSSPRAGTQRAARWASHVSCACGTTSRSPRSTRSRACASWPAARPVDSRAAARAARVCRDRVQTRSALRSRPRRDGASFPFLVGHPGLRQLTALLAEVAYLDERRPQLERAPDVADDVVHDPAEVLLEEVGLEAVERLLQVAGEPLQRMPPLLVRLRRSSASAPRGLYS